MVYKKLYISVILRVIALSITLFAFAFVLLKWDDPLILINLVAVALIQVVLFIRNMNQVNYKLTTFIESLHFDDISLFSTKGFQDKSFQKLYRSMQDVLISAQQKNSENYKQKQFYQTINEHTGTALLVFNNDEEILIKNQAFKDLFNIADVKNLAEIETGIRGFVRSISVLKPGEQKLMGFTLESSGILNEGTELELSVKKTLIRFDKEDVHILSFQNISSELENKESESWEKIIRVLTHEIMNTSGPLVSSAQTLIELVAGQDRNKAIQAGDINQELIHDLLEGLKIIEDRSRGLDKFVKDFRKVTLLPEPSFERISMYQLVNNLSVLFDKNFRDDEIRMSVDVPEDLYLFCDKVMMEQLLINILNNAIDALGDSGTKRISISAREIDHKIQIQVTDTGSGLSSEDLEKIFIPFYTKKKKGSGIGLSLARQIMRKHGGTINMRSNEGKGSTVVLNGIPMG